MRRCVSFLKDSFWEVHFASDRHFLYSISFWALSTDPDTDNRLVVVEEVCILSSSVQGVPHGAVHVSMSNDVYDAIKSAKVDDPLSSSDHGLVPTF